jgi:hypothetical protein
LKTKLSANSLLNKSLINDVLKEFVDNIDKCRNDLDNIFYDLPFDWNIHKEEKKDYILRNIFSEEWIKNCKKNFRFIFNYYLKK